MNAFKLTFGGIEYDVSSNHQDKKDQNWYVRAKWQTIDICWTIPIEAKFSTNQIMSFIASFHNAFYQTLRDERVDLTQH